MNKENEVVRRSKFDDNNHFKKNQNSKKTVKGIDHSTFIKPLLPLKRSRKTFTKTTKKEAELEPEIIDLDEEEEKRKRRKLIKKNQIRNSPKRTNDVEQKIRFFHSNQFGIKEFKMTTREEKKPEILKKTRLILQSHAKKIAEEFETEINKQKQDLEALNNRMRKIVLDTVKDSGNNLHKLNSFKDEKKLILTKIELLEKKKIKVVNSVFQDINYKKVSVFVYEKLVAQEKERFDRYVMKTMMTIKQILLQMELKEKLFQSKIHENDANVLQRVRERIFNGQKEKEKEEKQRRNSLQEFRKAFKKSTSPTIKTRKKKIQKNALDGLHTEMTFPNSPKNSNNEEIDNIKTPIAFARISNPNIVTNNSKHKII